MTGLSLGEGRDKGSSRGLGHGSRRMTIRFRLGLGLAIALLPILVLGALQTYVAFRHDAELRRASLVQAAQRSAADARFRVRSAAAILETLSPDAVGLECAPRLARVLQRMDGYTNLVRIDAQARVQCAAATVRSNPDRNTRPWFVHLRAGSRFEIAKAIKAPVPTVIAAIRVDRADGAFDGALLAVMTLASLRPDVSDAAVPDQTAVAITDQRGEILLQTDAKAFAPLPGGWVRDGALFTARDAAGQLRTHVAAPLIKDNVYVVLSAPAPGVLSWARINPFASIVLPLLMWAAAWMVVWIVTERVVVRWLAYLNRIAGLFVKGRFSVRAVHAHRAPREIRDLALTMDAMAETIVARDALLTENIAQKDAMMREIHHRVKNNLQVITSLLNMQQRALTDPAARTAIYDTRQRITALALIYRALYQSSDLRRVDVRQFLEELIASQITAESGRAANLRTELTADDLEVDPDKLAPLALFAVEAIAQARKHAFPPEGGWVRVRFSVGAEVVLEIEDDGVEHKAEAADGVGRTLMNAYARQLRGKVRFEPTPVGGLSSHLSFPAPQPSPSPIEEVDAEALSPPPPAVAPIMAA